MTTSSENSAAARPANRAQPIIRTLENLLVRVAPGTLRWALGVTLLSAVADRFGGWGLPGSANASWGDWTHFVAYTARVNGFLPATLAPALAVAATATEIVLGVALLLGVYRRVVAWAAAGLFVTFAAAMSISFGVKAPLNYSVFADAAAALLLGAWNTTPPANQPTPAKLTFP